MNLVAALKSGLDVHKDQAFQLNYAIANDPELSGEEFHACQRYVDACRALGMAVEENFTGQKTAFRAVVSRSPKAVLKIALLAEYDALPGVGHGCGHSANGAMSLLAAAALK
ncbi:MAG: M20 family peptidase, partial [Megasphaera sp.]|nr:M20 family peptidase [Megasphaera sp.]